MSIQWQGNRSDVTAKEGSYTLRAEMMDKGLWWWCVYHGEKQVASVYDTDKWPTTRIAAQRAAEKAMNEHLTEQQAEK